MRVQRLNAQQRARREVNPLGMLQRALYARLKPNVRGMGVSRVKIIGELCNTWALDIQPAKPLDGDVENWVGVSADYLTNLQLLGPEHDLQAVALTVFFSNRPEQVDENFSRVRDALRVLMPGWTEAEAAAAFAFGVNALTEQSDVFGCEKFSRAENGVMLSARLYKNFWSLTFERAAD